MDMGSGPYGMGDALLLALDQFVLASPASGPVTGVTVGRMLTRLSWMRWNNPDLAIGIGSAALHNGLITAALLTDVIPGSEVIA